MSLIQSSIRIGSSLRVSPLASTSTRPLASFHTSTTNFAESARARDARLTRKQNISGKEERARIQRETRPHVVLGTRPGDEAKWANCDLAKVILTPAQIQAATAATADASSGTHAEDAELLAPRHMNYGVDGAGLANIRDENVTLLFDDLKAASAKYDLTDEMQDELIRAGTGFSGAARLYKLQQEKELVKTGNFARAIDLRNANARGIAFENRKRVVAAFSPPGKDNDTGYPEVQIALITMKIRGVWSHLVRCKKDIHGRRAIRKLIHQRAKILKYLKGVDRDRYDRVLQRVALEPESVEGELVV